MKTVAVAAVALTLAGCAGTRTVSAPVTVTDVTTVEEQAIPGDAPTCTVYDRGTAQFVDVTGLDAGAVCTAIARKWSSGSSFWSPHGGRVTSDELACSMRRGGIQIDVWDSPGGFRGQSTCGNLASDGWADVTQPFSGE